jgi:hypothetical protein
VRGGFFQDVAEVGAAKAPSLVQATRWDIDIENGNVNAANL